MAKAGKGMTKGFKALGKIKSKQWKGMQGAMGAMGKVDFSSFISFFSELATVKPILSILTALMKVWINSILIPLLPLTRMLIQEMVKLIPLAKAWGTVIGVIILNIHKFFDIIPQMIVVIQLWGSFAQHMINFGNWIVGMQENLLSFQTAGRGAGRALAEFIAKILQFTGIIGGPQVGPIIGGGGFFGGIGGGGLFGGGGGLFGGGGGLFGGGGGSSGGGGGSITGGLIPGLQGGGTIRGNLGGGTLARLGERGDETVINSDQLDELILETRRARQDANFRNAFERKRRR